MKGTNGVTLLPDENSSSGKALYEGRWNKGCEYPVVELRKVGELKPEFERELEEILSEGRTVESPTTTPVKSGESLYLESGVKQKRPVIYEKLPADRIEGLEGGEQGEAFQCSSNRAVESKQTGKRLLKRGHGNFRSLVQEQPSEVESVSKRKATDFSNNLRKRTVSTQSVGVAENSNVERPDSIKRAFLSCCKCLEIFTLGLAGLFCLYVCLTFAVHNLKGGR